MIYDRIDPYSDDPYAQTSGSGDYIPPPAGQEPPPPVYAPQQPAPVQEDRYNGGSPPNIPLQADHGWEWNGSDWIQVKGRGIGWVAPAAQAAPSARPSNAPTAPQGGGQLSGVPQAWNAGQSSLSGSVPTLADAIRDSKQLQQAPAVKPYEMFNPANAPGRSQRDALVNAIMNRPQVMDQTFQDQLFEQQKEAQSGLAQQARQRAAQQGASRGMSGGGGYQARTMGGIEEGFMNTLLAGKRDIATQAAQVNRQAEMAAIQMQEAVAQGDFVRANAAYETQLKAANLYDELRFKAAEFDRSNVALSAQVGMAGRQQQLGEQQSSFAQYVEKLKFEEMMRQFNEQIGLDYGKFNWNQQMDISNKFPR